MSKRRFIIVFMTVITAWTIAVAVAGALNVPHGMLLVRYAFGHWPWFVFQIFVLWVLVPTALLLVLMFLLLKQISRVDAFFKRLTYGTRETPPDREAWAYRLLIVASLFAAIGQTWQTIAMSLYWHRSQLPWVAEAVHGPHVWGLPDPHQIILRGWLALAGALFARVGNGLPKLLTPFRGGNEPYDWSKMIRVCGWVVTVGGILGATAGLLIPDLQTAALTGSAVLVASLAAMVPIWAGYRLSGNRMPS